jgi:glycosyltransferase involved in cell wall biosynthesis
MRIAHVTATFPPYYAGTGNVCYHNARVLAARGHDVHVFTADWPGELDDPPGVTVHRLKPVARIGNAPVLPQLLRLGNFDLIHLHYPFIVGAELVALGVLARRTPLVLTYHNDLLAPGWRGRFFAAYERFPARAVLQAARGIGAVTLDHAAESPLLQHASGTRIMELPNGVDADQFHPGVDGRAIRERFGIPTLAFVAVFIGALDAAHHFKRVDLLLRVVASLDGIRPHLLVVGGGDLQPTYERLAQDLGIAGLVHFAGPVAQRDLPPYIAAGDLLVLPSDVESFGLVLIEAMACGRPVIATDLPGPRRVVTHGQDGFLVPAGDAKALAETIQVVQMMSGDERMAMGAAGRAKVEACYDWGRIGDRLEAVYATLLGGKESSAAPVFPAQLPIDLRAALDLIALRSGGLYGSIQARVIGEPRLVVELGGYAPVADDPSQLIALGAGAQDLRAVISASRPERVLTLVEGPLGGLLRPARANPATLPVDLPIETWQGLGYVKVMSRGIRGLGSIGWAAGERILERLNRSDLADRCRVAMLRTLATSRVPGSPAMIEIHEYRRVA